MSQWRYLPFQGHGLLFGRLIRTQIGCNGAQHQFGMVTKGHGIEGHGRNGSRLPPPAQIRTCGITAYDSCLEF